MKVAFISSLNGGVGTYTIGLIKELSKYVEKIDLYLFSGYKHIPVPELPENVEIITIQKSPISLLIRLFFFMNHLKKYDVIHLNYASFFLPIYVNKKIWKVPYIYTSHNFPTPETARLTKKLPRIFEAICLKFSSKNANAHIAISDYTKMMIKERYKTSPEIAINHGIDTKKFKFGRDKGKVIRDKLGITANEILMLFVGMLYKHKNVLTLIDAMPSILKNNKNAKLLIIGRGDQYTEITNRIDELGIKTSVIIKKYVEDINAYYSAADLFVLPSTNEGFGFVLLEAMACGLPIVASNCSSCPEVVGDAGLLFNPKSSEDLADKIVELMDNKELYEKLKEKGLERVKQFTWERAAEQYYGVYKKVLEEE